MQQENKRTSFYSRSTFQKGEGVRFVLFQGHLVLDETQTLPGRGAYLLAEEIPLVLQAHAWGRAFHTSVTTLEEETIKKAYESRKK
jgi:predicted RNA-binding protein YlxR (DUF448 family)